MGSHIAIVRKRAFWAVVLSAVVWTGASIATHPWGFRPPGDMRLFGDLERASRDLSRFGQWTALLARYRREEAGDTCRDCPVGRWKTFLDTLRGQPKLAQLRQVQTYVNMLRFVDDWDNYGASDYWATPREFLARGGDCEDFAATKYFSLQYLGWDMSRVRLVVGTELRMGGDHAVLAVEVDGAIYILDNLMAEVTDQRRIAHFRPIYSLNEQAWWYHTRPIEPAFLGPERVRGVASDATGPQAREPAYAVSRRPNLRPINN
jgi:predicted transglutaminase-like cysteine proteinase